MDSGLVTDVDTVVDDAVVDDAVVMTQSLMTQSLMTQSLKKMRTENITDEEGGESNFFALGPRSFTTEHCDNIIQKK
jgi:hypothetical protein